MAPARLKVYFTLSDLKHQTELCARREGTGKHGSSNGTRGLLMTRCLLLCFFALMKISVWRLFYWIIVPHGIRLVRLLALKHDVLSTLVLPQT
jgi:hypothetical protein